MDEEKIQYLDYAGLKHFKEKLTSYIDDADAEAIKSVSLSTDGKSIDFYKDETITEDSEPAYSVEFPEVDLSAYMELVTAAVEGNIAVFDADGQVIDSEAKLADYATAAFVGVIPEGYSATTIAEYAKELADNVAANGYDDTELKSMVQANTNAIEVLNGDEDVTGSVAQQIADAVSSVSSELEEEISKKADSATTLEGYGIEDAYTKDETDTAIAEAVAGADHLKRVIVDSVDDIDVNAEDADQYIYMVLRSDAEDGNTYDEYMVINGKVERVGDWAVDLSDYATNEEVESAVATAKDEAVAAAEEYADSLSDNYATAEQGAKADTAIQSVTSGSSDGTIAVDGTDVPVTGLGSAAYTDEDAYDAAGSADDAYSKAVSYADSLIDDVFVAITDDEIDALF